MKKKLYGKFVHVRTNDLMNNVNLLNNAFKILKVISKNSTSTNLAFFSIITKKDKKGH